MNKNYKSKVNKNLRHIFSAVCLLVFILTATVFAQTPPLRANGKIAFTSDRDGNREIYLMNADGSNQTRITNNSIVDDHPTWSPDGRKIAFVSQKQNGSFAIFRMSADGTDRTEITALNDSYWAMWKPLSWSPDGRRIAFHDSSSVSTGIDIFVVNLDGSGRQNLTADHAHLDLTPTWSPDGSKILFSRYDVYPPVGYGGTMLHTINVDGTNLTALVNGFADGWNEDSADWSPSVDKIVYSVNRWDFVFALYIANPDGTGRQFFHGCDWTDNSCKLDAVTPAFSPDGTKIAFGMIDFINNTPQKLYVKNLDGTGLTLLINNGASPSWQPLVKRQALADFDGDGRADISVFRPSDRTWYFNQSTNGLSATQFGLSTDKIVPADYDGDGKTDIAVFREGVWYLQRSTAGFMGIAFGDANDIPQPADFDGDGKADLALWRPSNGTWFVLNLVNNQSNAFQFGASEDKPVVADYDGDGKADYAVFRLSNGTWYIQQSRDGFTAMQFGDSQDKPVPADYDGDGKTDIAVFRPSNGTWYLQRSQLGFTATAFGFGSDLPVPADYDGDGKADLAVFRNGTWYLQRSSQGFTGVAFGEATDKPAPNAFIP